MTIEIPGDRNNYFMQKLRIFIVIYFLVKTPNFIVLYLSQKSNKIQIKMSDVKYFHNVLNRSKHRPLSSKI